MPTTTTTVAYRRALLPERIILPALAITAGSARVAKVIVDNNTGRVFAAYGCKRLFQIILGNDQARQVPASASCIQRFPILIGYTTYLATFTTRYSRCVKRPPAHGVPLCLSDGKPPPLPFGIYKVILVAPAGLVRPPSAVSVLVIAKPTVMPKLPKRTCPTSVAQPAVGKQPPTKCG